MSKKPPPKNNRKPPEPADSHAVIRDWMDDDVMPGIKPIVEQVDALVRRTHSGLQYAVKWKKAYYGLPDHGWIIELAAYHVSANVVFHGGAKFDAPPPLGEGAGSRYVKLRSVEEVDTPAMREWIRQAGATPGWKG